MLEYLRKLTFNIRYDIAVIRSAVRIRGLRGSVFYLRIQQIPTIPCAHMRSSISASNFSRWRSMGTFSGPCTVLFYLGM
jgi:hypothetical protein